MCMAWVARLRGQGLGVTGLGLGPGILPLLLPTPLLTSAVLPYFNLIETLPLCITGSPGK